jgi:hypothetical protein
VKLSPIATKDVAPGGCGNRLSIVHPSCQDTWRYFTDATRNDLAGPGNAGETGEATDR